MKLFLSSGVIRNSDYTMDQLVLVAKTLREVHDFRGYIHLKLIPEADPRLVEMAGLYADRLRFSPPVKFGANVTPPRAFRPEYGIGTARLDVELVGKTPQGQTALAHDLVGCKLFGGSDAVKRISANFGEASLGKWRDYKFSFVPNFDCRARVMTLGGNSEKTMFADVRVEGVPFEGASFGSGLWRSSRSGAAMWANSRDPLGVVNGPDAPRAPDGGPVAVSTHLSPTMHDIDLKAGVRVSISFKARQWEGD